MFVSRIYTLKKTIINIAVNNVRCRLALLIEFTSVLGPLQKGNTFSYLSLRKWRGKGGRKGEAERYTIKKSPHMYFSSIRLKQWVFCPLVC